MIPPKCDSPCHARRLRMYIIYLGILLICIVLALYHFIIHMIVRRKVKEEARDYFARRHSTISYYSSEQLYPSPVFQSVQDNITISTDGSTALRIEMPEESSEALHNNRHTSASTSTSRPLQKIPEEQDEHFASGNGGLEGFKMSTVSVDVHSNGEINDKKESRGNSSIHHNHVNSKSRFNFPRSGRTNAVTPVDTLGNTNLRGMMTNGPVTVAVATVSAIVAQATYQFDTNNALSSEAAFGVGNISRPTSASSCFDISDIVDSPEIPRKKIISKSKTC